MTSNLFVPRPSIARRVRLVGLSAAIAAVALAGCSAQASTQENLNPQNLSPRLTTAVPFSFVGPTAQQYVVPDGVTSISIDANGAGGGKARQWMNNAASKGAHVTGILNVTPGQILQISVAGAGADASDSNHDPKGGWGGLGGNGGNGNSASDTLRTGGAGGGATTIQLTNSDGSNPQTILVAGGGGGGGGRSGDLTPRPYGGSAGCTADGPSWTGSKGSNGSSSNGGKGGAPAAEAGPAGGRSVGGSGLGGNGGGGGGGVIGGAPGTSAKISQAAGGGGAGSSMYSQLTNITVTCGSDGGNGQVTVTPTNA